MAGRSLVQTHRCTKGHLDLPLTILYHTLPLMPSSASVAFTFMRKVKAVKVKGRDFQTATSPPTLPRLDILLLHLSQGAYQLQSKINYPPLVTGQQA